VTKYNKSGDILCEIYRRGELLLFLTQQFQRKGMKMFQMIQTNSYFHINLIIKKDKINKRTRKGKGNSI